MRKVRILMLTLAVAAVSACAGPQTASRNAINASVNSADGLSQSMTALSQLDGANIFVPDVSIAKITVDVPRTLTVSEKNTYYPKGDIVWRGDLIGDRHEQIKSILTDSAERAAW